MKVNLNRDIGIDLGTANILVAIKGKGIVYREPSVVAINLKKNEVIACGNEAREMLGRTPDNIIAIRPLKDGVIADFTATKLMLKTIMRKICKKYKIKKPRVVVGIPSGITEVEERAVEEVIISSGAKNVYLIDEPIAAAIGSGLNISDAKGNIIVDIGGGTIEVAVISLGGIVTLQSIRIAGDEISEDIINYIKRKHNLIIGDVTAENIKHNIGCATSLMTESFMEVRGRNTSNGLPENIMISSTEIEEAIKETMLKIVDVIRNTLEQTPPELVSDISQNGIMLAGGGALIKNIDKLINEKTEIPVYIADSPLDCVVRGTLLVLEDIDKLKKFLKRNEN